MKQARKRGSNKDQSRCAWPTTVRAAIPFAPSDNCPEVVVHFIDYAIFAVLQLTSIAKESFAVTDLIVNGEFRPVLAVANISDQFFPLRFPIQMGEGSSLGAVLRAPATRIAASACYPKMPESLVVSTDHGDFTFNALELIRPGGGSPATLCVGL